MIDTPPFAKTRACAYLLLFSLNLQWHVFGDDHSLNFAQKTLDQSFSSLKFDRRQQFSSQFHLYNLADIEEKISDPVTILMKYFTGKESFEYAISQICMRGESENALGCVRS